MALMTGVRLGPYEIAVLLGIGGMAEVYRARDVRLGRDVAIKILPDDFSADPEALARFAREAKTASALNHPHLVTIHDIGEADVGGRRVHYIAMELIDGETLRHHLESASRDEILRYLADIADGLAKAHDAGVVHRDLKPENVIVSHDGYAKVVDFGLAKHVPKPDAGSSERLTAEGYAVGTLGYMAPEQVRGDRDLDARVDVFAFGCILYEAIGKRRPFDGLTPVDEMHSILYREPPPLPDVVIERIARRCLAKDRRDRYASMRELSTDVRNAIATPVRRPFRRRLWLSTAAMLALAAGASGAFVAFRDTRPPAIESIAVLPFRNATGDDELRFLSDGIADEVVRDLGRVPSLRVIASASASRFRDTTDPQAVARELKVDAVLVGRVRAVAGTMLLDAELVKAEDGSALWGKKYSRKLTDVVALEQEIASDLCDEVRLELAPVTTHEPKPEAYEAYLRGKREYGKDTISSLNQAIRYYQRAIELDPDYALPYAALASVYGRQALLGMAPTRNCLIQEVALAEKSLSLDPLLPEGHWNLAFPAKLTGDFAEYERRAARVLQLNPNFSPAYLERANQLVLMKKFDEAEAAFQRARRVDPLSPRIMSSYASHLAVMKQFDRALQILHTVTEQFPEYANAYAYLATTYSYSGRHAEALDAIDRAPMATLNTMARKAQVYARAGRFAEARKIIDEADEIAKTRYIPTYYRVKAHAELGDREIACAMIEQGFREGEWFYDWIAFEPGFDVLHGEPCFEALVAAHRGVPAGRIPQ